MRIKILLTIILFYNSSCAKKPFFPGTPIVVDSSKCIVHRGGRTETLPENSLEGCIAALPMMDGIEVDVQISKNGTIWLSHSAIVEDNGEKLKCFAETTDDEINDIIRHTDNGNAYSKLEDVFKYMHENNIRKYIIIDQKLWEPCSINSLNIPSIVKLEADNIIELGEKYQLTHLLLFESDYAPVLSHAKKRNPLVTTFVISMGEFDKGMKKALLHNCDGISFKSNFKDELDEEKITLLHQQGLRMMAWGVPDSASMQYLKSIKVDFIQWDLK